MPFFDCSLVAGVIAWMSLHGHTNNLVKEMKWSANKKHRRHCKNMWYNVCLAAAVYVIWEERNWRIFRGITRHVDVVVYRIKYVAYIRMLKFGSADCKQDIIRCLGQF